MIRNNLKVAVRVLLRDRTFTAINILGLSTGFAIAALILMYTRFEFSYEDGNPLAPRIARITMDYLNGGTVIDQDAETYPALGPMIKEGYAEVIEYTRAQSIRERSLKIGDEFFSAKKILAVDPTFFRLFNYPLDSGGSEGVFDAPYEIVLTVDQALKYFNRTDVVGESVQMTGVKHPFQVVGIIENPPLNTHLKFDILISFSSLKTGMDQADDTWNANNTFTYLLLNDESQFSLLSKSLVELTNELVAEDKIENELVIAQPISDIHLYSHKSYEPEPNGDASSVFILLGIAFLVIIVAMVNYINLSTAKSLERGKEVGIRKVIGSSTGQLRWQFLSESFMINLLAVISAVVLVTLMFDLFRGVVDLPNTFTFLDQSFFWLLMGSLLLGSTFLSGIFPAFILSSFQPNFVLKGRFIHSGFGSNLRKGLVIFQFAITTFLLMQTLAVKRQIDFMHAMDLGVNIEQTIVVASPGTEEYDLNFRRFRNDLKSQDLVESVGLSSCVPGLPTSEMGSTTGINLSNTLEEHNFNFYVYAIDSDFIPTLELELIAGANYLPAEAHEDQVIVNEESIKLWGIPTAAEAIGQKIDFWGHERTIIGVVRNFHQMSAKSAHIPIIFSYASAWHTFASIRTKPGDLRDQLTRIENIYEANFPNSPFDFFFLDREFEKQYRADLRFQSLFKFLTLFAILIACLGLFGLVSFSVSKRAKEVGIRKVLGANLSQIVSLLSKDFIWLILVAIVVATPITYYLIKNWLLTYAFRFEIDTWLFLGPAFLVVSISLFIVLLKTFQFALVHPATSMRDD